MYYIPPLLTMHACVGLECVCVCVCVCVRDLRSWRCQVVPGTEGSWHAGRQWSDWSKTTREEQAELPAAISLPVSDGYGQGSQICSARLCYGVRESQCDQGDSVNPSLVMNMVTLTNTRLLLFHLDHWAMFSW